MSTTVLNERSSNMNNCSATAIRWALRKTHGRELLIRRARLCAMTCTRIRVARRDLRLKDAERGGNTRVSFDNGIWRLLDWFRFTPRQEGARIGSAVRVRCTQRTAGSRSQSNQRAISRSHRSVVSVCFGAISANGFPAALECDHTTCKSPAERPAERGKEWRRGTAQLSVSHSRFDFVVHSHTSPSIGRRSKRWCCAPLRKRKAPEACPSRTLHTSPAARRRPFARSCAPARRSVQVQATPTPPRCRCSARRSQCCRAAPRPS